jgi:hypothetical protein
MLLGEDDSSVFCTGEEDCSFLSAAGAIDIEFK